VRRQTDRESVSLEPATTLDLNLDASISISMHWWLLSTAEASNSDSGCGGGNGVDNACGACGRRCGDSVYGTYDHHGDDVRLLPSLHLLSE
jgi:hypothetical protein